MSLCMGMCGVQKVSADVADDFLDQLMAEDIELSGGYAYSFGSEAGHDENILVYYQQGTGVNTLNDLRYYIDYVVPGLISFISGSVFDDGLNMHRPESEFDVEARIISNPADTPGFIDTPQDFEIKIELDISHNQKTVTLEKTLPARVLEVKGKAIEAKDNRFAIDEKELILDQNRSYSDYRKNLRVRLFDGTIEESKVKEGFIMNSGHVNYDAITGKYEKYFYSLYYYNLQYIIENSVDCRIAIIDNTSGYYLDADGNVTDIIGNVLIPYASREYITCTDHNKKAEVKALQGTFSDHAELDVKPITNLNLIRPYRAFDVALMVKGNTLAGEYKEVRIQPEGSIQVTLEIPDQYKNDSELEVSTLDENGKLEKMTYLIKDGKISFETDRLGTYVFTGSLSEEPSNPDDKQEPTTPSHQEQINDKQETDKQEDVIKNTAYEWMIENQFALILLGVAAGASLFCLVRKAKAYKVKER